MNYNHTILYVPKGTKNNYAFSTGWKNFMNIVEMEDSEDADKEYMVITKKNGEVIKIAMDEIESITPKHAEPGDIDGNGEVNVVDLTKLIDMLLKK